MKLLNRLLDATLALLMATLVFSVAWQIFSRYLFAVPAAWTEELARFLLIWIGTLGAACAYRSGSHIGLDILPSKLTPVRRRQLEQVTHGLCFVFAVTVMIIGGGSLMSMTWELRQYSAAMELPIAAVYSVIPASGVLICVYALRGIMLDAPEPATEGEV